MEFIFHSFIYLFIYLFIIYQDYSRQGHKWGIQPSFFGAITSSIFSLYSSLYFFVLIWHSFFVVIVVPDPIVFFIIFLRYKNEFALLIVSNREAQAPCSSLTRSGDNESPASGSVDRTYRRGIFGSNRHKLCHNFNRINIYVEPTKICHRMNLFTYCAEFLSSMVPRTCAFFFSFIFPPS
jgi:hypothetical protein